MRQILKWMAFSLVAGAVGFIIHLLNVRTSPSSSAGSVRGAQAVFSEGGILALPLPTDNAITEKARLGLDLFREVKLSRDNSISCQSCHDLNSYGADSKPFSFGVNGQIGDVNTPTVFNAVYNFRQFWDGRALNLAEQIGGPVHNPKEMATDWPTVIAKLKADASYVKRFETIYGHEPDESSIVDALVSFESVLTTPNSRFDQYLRGNREVLSMQEIEGFKKFQLFGCTACHQGANVGGNMYQTLGIMGDYFKDRGGAYASDAGRFAVTHRAEDIHLFKVPSLRNVGQTAPYFHDGQAKTLGEAVKLMGRYQLGRQLSKSDIADLVSFLNSLTGERPEILKIDRGVANEKAH